MEALYKKALLVITAIVFCIPCKAFVDRKGNESTQYLLDYETLEKTYFDIESIEELWSYMQNNLLNHTSWSEDETGVTLEIDLRNAIFYNICADGYYDDVHDGFVWDTGHANTAAEYILIWKDNNYEHYGPYWETYILPGKDAFFYLKPGKTVKDVKCTVLDLETKDIGQHQLLKWIVYRRDKPAKCEDEDSNRSTQSDEYIPSELYYINVETVPYLENEAENTDRILNIILYFGQFRKSDWSLRAVTHAKFHISNCSGYPAGIQNVTDEGDDVRPRYFNMQGMEVRQPEHGKMYIIREGSKSRKAIYK